VTRTFEDAPAVRTAVPLLVGLVGPSGSGKTFSALRLATGIQRVTGGDIFFIDTEARRALHYADQFRFRHLEFSAPFGPLDYLAAVQHCVRKGGRVIVVDSMSHEHEGPGGVLEAHDAEVERLSGGDPGKAARVGFQAWSKPKAERRRMLNSLLQLNANFVFCFRAKEKLKPVRGKEPEQLGWMPIAGEELVYEMTANLLLLPASNGVPTWQSDFHGERAVMKRPMQFANLFGQQLDEATGQAMAEWAKGAVPEHPLVARFRDCKDAATFEVLKVEARAAWATASPADRSAIKAAIEQAEARLASEQPTHADDQPSGDTPPGGMSREESLALDAQLAEEQQLL